MSEKDKQARFIGMATVVTLSLILFYLPSVMFMIGDMEKSTHKNILGLIMATFYTAGFFLNYFWLVPSMVTRNHKVVLYFVCNAVMILGVMCFIPLWIRTHDDFQFPRLDAEHVSILRSALVYAGFSLRDGIMMILAVALGFALRMGREKENIFKKELELEAERRRLEIRSLKAQLNPHFLFNSLNNIYALIGFDPEKAKESLHDLSKMLRFMIYEASAETVSLEREGDFIREYVALMGLRLGGCSLECNIESKWPGDLKIAPLIYLTLVENAFKYAAHNGKEYFICISLFYRQTGSEVKGDGEVVFEVENTFADSRPENMEETGRGGIGISNVKRQLNLLYGTFQRFEESKSEGVYRSRVSIIAKALEWREED